jgi:hypothetical protein
MAWESTQPPTEMSTRNLPGDKGQPVHKVDNCAAICERRLSTQNVGASMSHKLMAFMACYRNSFTFFFFTFLRSLVVGLLPEPHVLTKWCHTWTIKVHAIIEFPLTSISDKILHTFLAPCLSYLSALF